MAAVTQRAARNCGERGELRGAENGSYANRATALMFPIVDAEPDAGGAELPILGSGWLAANGRRSENTETRRTDPNNPSGAALPRRASCAALTLPCGHDPRTIALHKGVQALIDPNPEPAQPRRQVAAGVVSNRSGSPRHTLG